CEIAPVGALLLLAGDEPLDAVREHDFDTALGTGEVWQGLDLNGQAVALAVFGLGVELDAGNSDVIRRARDQDFLLIEGSICRAQESNGRGGGQGGWWSGFSAGWRRRRLRQRDARESRLQLEFRSAAGHYRPAGPQLQRGSRGLCAVVADIQEKALGCVWAE